MSMLSIFAPKQPQPSSKEIESWRKQSEKIRNNWTLGEFSFCNFYRSFFPILSRTQFNQRTEYLRKCSDLGRKPTSFLAIALVFILFAIQGFLISYVFEAWHLHLHFEISHTSIVWRLMAAVVFASAMLTLNFYAGRQYYRTSLLRKALKESKGETKGCIRPIKLDEPQSVDDQSSPYRQVANRVGRDITEKGSYSLVILAIILSLIIANTAFSMNMANHQADSIREEAYLLKVEKVKKSELQGSLPQSVIEELAKADLRAQMAVQDVLEEQKTSSFYILASIFFAAQFMGGILGYRTGFVGRESLQAWQDIKGYSTYEKYLEHFRHQKDKVNAELIEFQKNMVQEFEWENFAFKTFDDFLLEQENQELHYYVEVDDSEKDLEGVKASKTISTHPTINQIKAELFSLHTEKLQDDYLSSLNAEDRNNAGVQNFLKTIREKRKKQDSIMRDIDF